MEMNPATVTPETLAGYRSLGVNRASFGVQTFDDRELKLLARGHDANDARDTFTLLRDAGFDNISFDLIAGLPRTIPLTSSEVMEALEQPLQQIVASVRQVLEETPPELSSDIIDKGMVMSGGGALLRNVDKLLTQVTGVPCHVAENPLNCVALGTGLALEHFDFFKKSLVQQI